MHHLGHHGLKEPDLDELFRILSPAFVGKGSKNLTYNEEEFQSILEVNLEHTDKPLYRGASIKEILFNNFCVGETIKFGRITSFTEDYGLAEDFSKNEYGTNCIFSLEGGSSRAFHYTKFMGSVLADVMEECKVIGDIERYEYCWDQMRMLYDEKEWMMGKNELFTVKDITFRSNINSKGSDTTIITIGDFLGNPVAAPLL